MEKIFRYSFLFKVLTDLHVDGFIYNLHNYIQQCNVYLCSGTKYLVGLINLENWSIESFYHIFALITGRLYLA